MQYPRDITGKVFNYLTVLDYAGKNPAKENVRRGYSIFDSIEHYKALTEYDKMQVIATT